MSSRTLGKLYPKSTDTRVLADTLTEHARQHEWQLSTNVSNNERLLSLEKRVGNLEGVDANINDKLVEIAVGIGKVKGAMWALGVVWTIGGFAVGLYLALKK